MRSGGPVAPSGRARPPKLAPAGRAIIESLFCSTSLQVKSSPVRSAPVGRVDKRRATGESASNTVDQID